MLEGQGLQQPLACLKHHTGILPVKTWCSESHARVAHLLS